MIARHVALYPMSKVKIAGKLPKRERAELLGVWRTRLHDISWFMRGLNEHISRMANKEDKVRGRFWEGRFKSQALVDERGLLACMVYVDLNPVRAGLSDSLGDSDFTSIQERLLDRAKKRSQHREIGAPKGMASFHKKSAEAGRAQGILPISFDDYVKLVEWTGQVLAQGGEYDPNSVPAAVCADGATGSGWVAVQSEQSIESASVLGGSDAVLRYASMRGKRSVRGIGVARLLTG